MSTHTWQTPNPLPPLHRLEPIRDRLACGHKFPVPESMTPQKIGSIDLKIGSLSHFISGLIELLARVKAEPPFKSP